MSLRRRIRIPPGKTVRLVYSTALARSREEAVNLARAYHETDASSRAFALAWARSQVELRYLNLSLTEAHLFQTMAAPLIFGDERELQHRREQIAGNRLGQEGLWAQGLSGEIPIWLLRSGPTNMKRLSGSLGAAHEYWRMKGFAADLVIINEEAGGYGAGCAGPCSAANYQLSRTGKGKPPRGNLSQAIQPPGAGGA